MLTGVNSFEMSGDNSTVTNRPYIVENGQLRGEKKCEAGT